MTTAISIIYIAAVSLHENLLREETYGLISYFGIIFPNILLYRFLDETNAHESKRTYRNTYMNSHRFGGKNDFFFSPPVIGIQWSNIFIPGNALYGLVGSPGFIFLFSILGAVIHFTLAVYINAILPGKYGVRKDPLYCLKVRIYYTLERSFTLKTYGHGRRAIFISAFLAVH